jgi:hypothetical protein
VPQDSEMYIFSRHLEKKRRQMKGGDGRDDSEGGVYLPATTSFLLFCSSLYSSNTSSSPLFTPCEKRREGQNESRRQ